ncbi:MAG: hypothetical protein RMH84_02600 [Sulfolobales archaeon]|nr:hypothetical protein [Sulfolobales archaeon]MCX8208589.1 hypothetical protein [Sulfolobales archaeon]MDW8010465.1 hypothetical protein [Sulfolobales archaeon]
MKNVGMRVYTNVFVDKLEVDLVAIEPAGRKPLVYVVEVKTRPKQKLLHQLLSRVSLADYVYAALPIRHYPYLLEIPRPAGSIGIDVDGHSIYEIKKPVYLGNGWKLLELVGSRPPQSGQ